DRLAAAVDPKKVVPAQVRLVDAPPGSRAQRIAAAREADVVLLVLGCFGPGSDPAGDLDSITLDLVVADLATVEKRHDTLGRELRVGKKEHAEEHAALEAAKAHLDAGRPLRTLPPAQLELLADLFPV